MSDREIIARLEQIGGGDAARGFGILCVAACICPACGVSWDNPAYACGCMNAIHANQASTTTRGSRP